MVAADNRPAERPDICFPELVHKSLLPEGRELVEKGNVFCFTESTWCLPWLEAQGGQARCWARSWWHYLPGPRAMI